MASLVVVPAGDDDDLLVLDRMNKPMCVIDPPRPETRQIEWAWRLGKIDESLCGKGSRRAVPRKKGAQVISRVEVDVEASQYIYLVWVGKPGRTAPKAGLRL